MNYIAGFVLLVALALPHGVGAETYFECVVESDASRGGVCENFRGYTHMCQLYDGYSGDGIPEHCSGFCVDRSDVPADCAQVSVRVSSNPEAHTVRAGVLDGTGLNTEFIEDIAGELQGALGGIENEIDTSDGIDQDEVTHIISRVIGALSGMFGRTQATDDTETVEDTSDTQVESTGVMDTVVAWTRKDLFCNDDKPRYIRKGTILSVTGDGKAWIERGIRVFRASEGAPLMGGDFIRVPEDMSVSVDLERTGVLKISGGTRFVIPTPSSQERKEQCVRGAIQNRISNGIRGSWIWLKNTLQGEQFEIHTPTAGGVRG